MKFADRMTPDKMHEIAVQNERLNRAEIFDCLLDKEMDPDCEKRLALLVVYYMFAFLFHDKFFTYFGPCKDGIKNCKDDHLVCKDLHPSIYDDTPLTEEFFKSDYFKNLNGRSRAVLLLMRDKICRR